MPKLVWTLKNPKSCKGCYCFSYQCDLAGDWDLECSKGFDANEWTPRPQACIDELGE